MSADPKWPRYVKASLGRYLASVAATVASTIDANAKMIVEGVHDRNPDFMDAPYKAEVVIQGPFTREVSKGYHRVWATVVVTVSSRTGNETDVHKASDIAGVYVAALTQCIDVRKYEASFVESDPTPELVGYLKPAAADNDSVGAQDVKATDTDKLKHSVVVAKFNGYFPIG